MFHAPQWSALPRALATAPRTSAVLAHLAPRTFYYAAESRSGSHMLWNAAYERGWLLRGDDVVASALARLSDRSDALVLLSAPLQSPERHGLRLLHATAGWVFGHGDEQFVLYEIAARPHRP
jgi:hypothetical protein